MSWLLRRPRTGTCPECGETFETVHRRQRFCSQRHRDRHRQREWRALNRTGNEAYKASRRKPMTDRRCSWCNRSFQSPGRSLKKYCQPACARSADLFRDHH